MRLGVLDIGSNTGHLLDADDAITDTAVAALVGFGLDDPAGLPGVSPNRAHPVIDIFDLSELQTYPSALREGIILTRLDTLSVLG